MTDGILLIHAFPLDARMWDAQRESLGGLPLSAPHLPGFGGTGLAGDVLSMATAARRCVAALDEAGIDRALVCGLSMGGYVAFELWRTVRHRILGLVLANTRAEADAPEAAERRRDLAARLLREGNVLIASPPPLLSDGASTEIREQVRGMIAAQPVEAIAGAALGMAERRDSTPDLPQIDVPTLVITSSEDALIPADVSAPMADLIPDAQLAVIDGAGHLSNLERPGEFSELLASHVARCGLA